MKKKISLFKEPSPIPFTKQGFKETEVLYEKLLSERPAAVADLKKARDMGDLSENGYYKSARWKLSDVDRQLRHLRYLLKYGKITLDTIDGSVGINTTVTVSDGEGELTYQIVGDYEANPRERKISTRSPLGAALLGKNIGNTAIFSTQQGEKKLKIISIVQSK